MEIHFVFRMPKFPVIISNGDRLFTARSPQSLVTIVFKEMQRSKSMNALFIDSTGEDFVYDHKTQILHPGFMVRRRTKKQLIDLYNSSENARASESHEYSEKSLSAKKYERIFNDICKLIQENPV